VLESIKEDKGDMKEKLVEDIPGYQLSESLKGDNPMIDTDHMEIRDPETRQELIKLEQSYLDLMERQKFLSQELEARWRELRDRLKEFAE
jgi:hypothetical protein